MTNCYMTGNLANLYYSKLVGDFLLPEPDWLTCTLICVSQNNASILGKLNPT